MLNNLKMDGEMPSGKEVWTPATTTLRFTTTPFSDKPYSVFRKVLVAVILAVSLAFHFSPVHINGPSCPWIAYKLPDLYSATLEEVVTGLQDGHFTSEDLTRAYLARIAEVNDILHVVIETNPHAIAQARISDSIRRRSNRKLGPFHGIPILLKDNIATARPDQSYMNTTGGSFALLGSIPARESTVAAKLKEGGAIILGKANLAQWSGFRASDRVAGWSSRGGQGTGVYVKNQFPWASSSGSAVAATLGLSFASIGTDTNGSIILPAQNSNLCGIRPSTGLVSRSMVIPISTTLDTIGPMARDCQTAAALLSVIAGKDIVNDPSTASIPFDTIPDYAKACTDDGLKGARIGVPTAFIASQGERVDPFVWQTFNQSFDIMRVQGAQILEGTEFAALQTYLDSEAESFIMTTEFVYGVKNYLDQLYYNPNNITNLEALMKFTQSDPREDYPNTNVDAWKKALSANTSLDSVEYRTALAEDAWIGTSGTLIGTMEKYSLDAIIVPTEVAPNIAALANLPVVTVPLGFFPPGTPITYDVESGKLVVKAPNVPFAISFIGRRFSEEKLIAYACAFEAATQVRNKGPRPYILPKATLKRSQ